jgi:hypothetical protein
MRVIVCAAFIAAALALPGCRKHARQTEPEPKPPSGAVEAAQLHKAYADNRSAATKEYGGKETVVAGYVEEVIKDPSNGQYYVGLGKQDDETVLVRCYFTETATASAPSVKAGQYVAIRGTPREFHSDQVRLQLCRLVESSKP